MLGVRLNDLSTRDPNDVGYVGMGFTHQGEIKLGGSFILYVMAIFYLLTTVLLLIFR